jgi:3',5'-cyclic AMP phosphodiesterase CpdA
MRILPIGILAAGALVGCSGSPTQSQSSLGSNSLSGTEETGDTAASGDADNTSASTTSASTSGTSASTTAPTSTTAGTDSNTTTGDPPDGTIPPENTRVAFFGDNQIQDASRDVLALIVSEGADFVVILGDFDYEDDPSAWHQQLDEVLGPDFPVFAVPGNHDTNEDGASGIWDEYRQVLMDRRAGFEGYDCTGTFSEQESCTFMGIHLALSAVGTLGDEGDHAQALADTWSGSDVLWRVCAWHKNQNDMQTGDKDDEVGWEAYQACQDGGAIIATGHEHTYSRTVTLTNLGSGDHGAQVDEDPAIVQVGPGSTFVMVSGVGGRGIRDWDSSHDGDTWWASYMTGNKSMLLGEEVDVEAEYGVAFIDFHVDGDPRKARGYFKTINGDVLDEWEIHSSN